MDDCPDIMEAIRLSERESMGRPGVVRVTGPGPSAVSPRSPGHPPAGYALDIGDTMDLDPASMETLTGMGFTPSQSAQALRMHNYDLHDAANFLLGNQ